MLPQLLHRLFHRAARSAAFAAGHRVDRVVVAQVGHMSFGRAAGRSDLGDDRVHAQVDVCLQQAKQGAVSSLPFLFLCL